MTKDNPIANLFLGIVEEKLGNNIEAAAHRTLAVEYLSQSDYWQKQFQALKIYNLI